ncbi:MAG: aminodeoxychorismate lyase, partial [Asticcacaulis sp.]|nr:aminodeoxychorismate lyase [Asticcacaulis sp.]
MKWGRRDRGSDKAAGSASALLAPLAGLVAGLALLVLAGGLFLYAQLYGPGPRPTLGQPVSEITFTRGMSVAAMGHALEQQHIIHSASMFRLTAKLRGHANGLRSGTYDFPAGASLIAVLG